MAPTHGTLIENSDNFSAGFAELKHGALDGLPVMFIQYARAGLAPATLLLAKEPAKVLATVIIQFLERVGETLEEDG